MKTRIVALSLAALIAAAPALASTAQTQTGQPQKPRAQHAQAAQPGKAQGKEQAPGQNKAKADTKVHKTDAKKPDAAKKN